ncbi:Sec17 protein [Saccharomycopsis crataegensis]|uniref:Sec17 protein n=1 Tax=Saccharomycopsis crataegensis TaxID=43959 RepID=A0AAV5QRX8_9ASCO|nr:Sec17 protein [Saccharomycopsis crataegensis]
MSSPEELIAQADKKCAPVGGFAKFFGGSSLYRFEEAADLYIQAANLYRIQKQYVKAGNLFEKASEAQKKAESIDESGSTLIDAFKSYREDSPQDAARVLKEAIKIFTTRGQFRRAANFKMDLAAIYEDSLNDLSEATQHYEQAGDWYSSDQAQALANKAYVKAADLGALAGNYIQAAALYESVAKKSLNNNLSKWSLKDYFFKSILCYLAADDMVAAKKTLDKFIDWDGSFQQTRECILLNDLFEAISDRDGQVFADKLYEFDQFSKLDKWKTTILLKIKSSIVEADDDIL